MQFNHAGHLQDRATLKPILESGDQAWRKDIGKRWGEFQMMLAARAQKTLEGHAAHPDIHTAKGEQHLVDAEAAIAKRRATARAYISGHLEVPDPVDAEITLRLYAQASTPKEAPAAPAQEPAEKPGIFETVMAKLRGE